MAKVGRKPYEANERDRRIISGMVLAGIPVKQICEIIGMGKETVYKYYKHEIQNTAGIKKGALASMAWNMALEGKSPQMTIFMCKTQLGWREKEYIEIDGETRTKIELVSDGSPLHGLIPQNGVHTNGAATH